MKYNLLILSFFSIIGDTIKGQAAAEYLVLLGVVLIISLIGILLLGGFSDSTATAMETESKTYWSSTRPFSIVEWVQSNSTLYLNIKNIETKRVILKQVVVGNLTYDLGAGWTFGPNSQKTISISGLTSCSQTYDYFSYPITFYYDTLDISNLSQKGLKPLAGRCLY
ncbi:MAG: hypothetical protein ACK4J0_02855 [Candidatus Anstonellaceae archaeon]